MTVAPQADTEIVVGTVASVEQKAADKWQVQVAPDGGGQYTKGLWTKDASFAQAMMQMHRPALRIPVRSFPLDHAPTAQPVRSLWLNGWASRGCSPMRRSSPAQPTQQPQQCAVPQQPAAQPAPSQPAVTAAAPQNNTEQKIHRQTATKVAAQLLKHLTPEHQTFDNLISISERLVAYYDHGVQYGPDGRDLAQQDDSGPGLSQADDDIPF